MSDVVVAAEQLLVGYGKRALLPPATFCFRREELWALAKRLLLKPSVEPVEG